MPKFLIGYDVESYDDSTKAFLQAASKVHRDLESEATIFIVGKTLEKNASIAEEVLNLGDLEFHQHTYSHVLLKTVVQENEEGITIFPSGSFDEVCEEIQKGQQVLKDILGVEGTGFTAPYNYYRGIGDRLDLLQVLRDNQIKFVRSAGRNERDWQPVPFEWQPYFYEAQGYGEILECPIHGWQDCIAREKLGWENVTEYIKMVKKDIDHACANQLDFVYGSHDWSSIRHDPELEHIAELIMYAREKGMEVINYSQYYEQKLAEKKIK
ncbi:polysaccharide deacetylase family protein [Pseudogracilibacillus auburnensis]|uniref:polysaccharide deacetylase family protein n=1 Tax=Pseudogracilibacillus auburnensis TaxID=1494959 RepID=UPI001A966E28|nr:polysaccharide deacetylase family protein [Pseudogracilibacillus auburnensis]MBO1003967.1 polysaccharide deacetylase family protein [Pseudogracilibacillus auburnensis]